MKTWLITSTLLAAIFSLKISAQVPEEVPPEALEEETEEMDVVLEVQDETPVDEGVEPFLDVDNPPTLQQSVDAPHRDARNRQRDEFRNPQETLEFFGIEPDMTVVEIWPAAGWYTEILAPYLLAGGTYYAAHFPEDSESDFYRNARNRYTTLLQGSAMYSNVEVTSFQPGEQHDIAPEGSADAVLTFRNLHNWYMRDGDDGLQNAFEAFYTALRPGGILGVVDHRLPEDRDDEEARDSGYIKQSWAVSAAEAAGFELVASSEINANPADTADHQHGVWSLPPTLRLGEDEDQQDQLRYIEIGESDRFTLKFRKPEE